MPGPAFRRGDRVALHPVEEDDLPFLQRLRTDPAVRRRLGLVHPENETRLRTWFEDTVADDESGTQFVVGADGDPVGFLALSAVRRPQDHCELHVAIHPDHRGEGYAADAVDLGVGYAFEEQRLHKVAVGVLRDDEAARRILTEVGFQREETRREERFVDGAHRDVLRYGILEGEW